MARPRFCRCRATLTPTIPAPRTITSARAPILPDLRITTALSSPHGNRHARHLPQARAYRPRRPWARAVWSRKGQGHKLRDTYAPVAEIEDFTTGNRPRTLWEESDMRQIKLL